MMTIILQKSRLRNGQTKVREATAKPIQLESKQHFNLNGTGYKSHTVKLCNQLSSVEKPDIQFLFENISDVGFICRNKIFIARSNLTSKSIEDANMFLFKHIFDVDKNQSSQTPDVNKSISGLLLILQV